jgi:hypothetical protein
MQISLRQWNTAFGHATARNRADLHSDCSRCEAPASIQFLLQPSCVGGVTGGDGSPVRASLPPQVRVLRGTGLLQSEARVAGADPTYHHHSPEPSNRQHYGNPETGSVVGPLRLVSSQGEVG